MLISFQPDIPISFDQLFDGRFDKYEIKAARGPNDVCGNPTGTLSCGESNVLVRSDSKGDVTKLIPTDRCNETSYVIIRVGAETQATFDAVSEPLEHFLEGELNKQAHWVG